MAATLGLCGSTVSYYEESLPTTMNPLFARSMVDRRSHELVFDRLFFRSAITNELKSRLVSKYERLDGGMKLKITLKDGVKWHDGKSLGPKDVCFTIDAMLSPDTPTTIGEGYREAIVSCEAIQKENAALIEFSKVYHNPQERIAFSVLPAHAFDSPVITPDLPFSTRPTGTGPMKGARGLREVKFTAFPNGHHAAKIGTLSQAEGGDPAVQVKTLLNNGVQGIISVAPPRRQYVAAADDVVLKSYDLRSWWFIAVNTHKPLLKDKRVRQAIHHTLDRFELRRLTMGYDPDAVVQPCQFISGPFIPSSPYYNRGVKVDQRSDLAKADELMEAAGAVKQHGVWTVDGELMSLKIGMAAPLDLEARDLLNQIGNQLQAGGFGRQVHKVSNDDWSNKAVTGQLSEDYDMLIGKWSFGVVENVGPLFGRRDGGRGSLNIFNFEDDKVDELTDQFRMAKTDTEAQDTYHALHSYLADELPYLFLWKLDTKSGWRMQVGSNTITPYWYFTEFDSWTFSE